MQNPWKWTLLAAAAIIGLATILPWYSRYGVHVTGFGGPTIGNPAWIALVCALLMAGMLLLPIRWRDMLLPWPIVVTAFLAAGNLWRAWRHGALGIGLPLMLAAVILAGYAAYQLSRKEKG